MLFRSPSLPVPRQVPRTALTTMRGATRIAGLRIATPEWQLVLADRARSAIAPDTWSRLVAMDAASTCTRFAQLADPRAGDVLDGLLTDLSPAPPVQAATDLANRLRALDAVDHVAQVLQVLGVYLCAAGGRDLGDCRCLRDLITDNGLAEAKRILRDGLSELAST